MQIKVYSNLFTREERENIARHLGDFRLYLDDIDKETLTTLLEALKESNEETHKTNVLVVQNFYDKDDDGGELLRLLHDIDIPIVKLSYFDDIKDAYKEIDGYASLAENPNIICLAFGDKENENVKKETKEFLDGLVESLQDKIHIPAKTYFFEKITELNNNLSFLYSGAIVSFILALVSQMRDTAWLTVVFFVSFLSIFYSAHSLHDIRIAKDYGFKKNLVPYSVGLIVSTLIAIVSAIFLYIGRHN